MNLCSLLSVYFLLWGIVMDQLSQCYNAVITGWGWRALFCYSDCRRKNPFSLSTCYSPFYLLFTLRAGALTHWFNGLRCHQHARRGTLAHTPVHIQTALQLWFLWIRHRSLRGACCRATQNQNRDFQGTLMSPGGRAGPGGTVTHGLAFRSSDFKKVFVCSQGELPSPQASVESWTYSPPPLFFFSWMFELGEHLFVNCSCDVMTILFCLEHPCGNFLWALC